MKEELICMKNKKNIIILNLLGINLLISIVLIVLFFLPNNKTLSATQIYNQSLYSVVEVKAETEEIGESFGTGEIISSDGKIITNAHVVTYTRLSTINKFEKYFIRFAFEKKYRMVKLLKYDNDIDLALLQLEDSEKIEFESITVGNSDDLKAGNTIYAIGNASNYGIGIFEGIISVPLVNIEYDGIKRTVIQCDITIAAGNSGGALLNDRGEFVGITTFRTKDTSGNVIYGIVYCIPIDIVLDYINI